MDRSEFEPQLAIDTTETVSRPSGRRTLPEPANRNGFDVSALATPPSTWPPLHGFDLWPDPALAYEAGIQKSDQSSAGTQRGGWFGGSSIFNKAFRFAAIVGAGWLGLVVALVVLYRFVDPPFSNLMAWQRVTGEDIRQVSVPIEAVSPNLVRAVMLSEDGRFCQHWGVDFEEMQNAIERAGDGIPRGASTISMQVTKNLFLWQSKSYLRKAIEIPLTFLVEILWPKRRIMEMYLNIAEWGPGIFGVEAASRFHFSKSALHLTEREAAQLAVALPNPIRRDAGDPGPQTRRLASDIQARMRNAPAYATSCVKTVRLPLKR